MQKTKKSVKAANGQPARKACHKAAEKTSSQVKKPVTAVSTKPSKRVRKPLTAEQRERKNARDRAYRAARAAKKAGGDAGLPSSAKSCYASPFDGIADWMRESLSVLEQSDGAGIASRKFSIPGGVAEVRLCRRACPVRSRPGLSDVIRAVAGIAGLCMSQSLSSACREGSSQSGCGRPAIDPDVSRAVDACAASGVAWCGEGLE